MRHSPQQTPRPAFRQSFKLLLWVGGGLLAMALLWTLLYQPAREAQVEWAYLRLQSQADTALHIFWGVEGELPPGTFEVERSPEGQHFHAIGRIEVGPEHGKKRDFRFLDNDPPIRPTGLYRIRFTDTHGRQSVSPAVPVAQAIPLM
ncbi:MAG: hypothetical protein D6730_07705 [Bacteroidetes bacterium]|nr:MAG: hypothetical protein D6730_07705 [Bacteroidota bacterium]